MEVGKVCHYNYAETKCKKSMKSEENFSVERANGTKELSEAEEMEVFKKEFYDDLSKITNHRTVINMAVNISEEAFEAMKDDPEYREKVLSLIQRDWGDSYAPRDASVLITIGATIKDYRADSWPVGYDSEFTIRSQDSFYKKTTKKKEKQKDLLEEYIEKRMQTKKLQQKLLDSMISEQDMQTEGFLQSCNHKRQMMKVSDVYEANVISENMDW